VGQQEVHSAVVIGAGIQGLATAWRLIQRGETPLVLDPRPVGHGEGSSHGSSRITRRTYANEHFVQLMDRANREDWPELETAVGRALVDRCGGCFSGLPGGLWDDFCATMDRHPQTVDRLSATEAAHQFPQFRFSPGSSVYHDRTAGVIDAEGMRTGLVSILEAAGSGIVRAEVRQIERGEPIRLRVEDAAGRSEEILAERIVVTAGSWVSALIPELEDRFRILPQTVGYFRPREVERCRPAVFPVWIRVGQTANDFYYGIGACGGDGLKVARHVTQGPTRPNSESDSAAAVQDLEAFAAEYLAIPLAGLERSEACLYTATPDENFVLDRMPDDSRIVVGAGFSGHGFKFAPLIGRILSRLLLDGKTEIAEFENHREAFAIT